MADSICGWIDPLETGEHLELQTIGASGARWNTTSLTWSLGDFPDLKGISYTTFGLLIQQALNAISMVSILNFTQTNDYGSAHLKFLGGGAAVDSRFGSEGGVIASAKPPVYGEIQFDSAEMWLAPAALSSNGSRFLPTALHEILHALGLGHSDNPASVMYPYALFAGNFPDPETIRYLQETYGWSAAHYSGSKTSDRPSLCAVPWVTLTDAGESLHMFYRGADDDQIWEQTFDDSGKWASSKIPTGFRSSHSPSLASRWAGVAGTGSLALACKGPGTNQNPHIAVRDQDQVWSLHRLDKSGSLERPAVAYFDNGIWMVWRGAGDDRTLYWSMRENGAPDGNWKEQEKFPNSASTHAPTMTEFRGRLWAFWKGTEGDSTIYYSSRGPGNSFWDAQQQLRWERITTAGAVWEYPGTSSSPSVVVRRGITGDHLYIVWKGADQDSRIWFSDFDGEQFTGQNPLGDFVTSASPDITAYRGQLVLAWRDANSPSIVFATL